MLFQSPFTEHMLVLQNEAVSGGLSPVGHQSAPLVPLADMHRATLYWSGTACTLIRDKKSLSLDESISRDLDEFYSRNKDLQKRKREGSTGD